MSMLRASLQAHARRLSSVPMRMFATTIVGVGTVCAEPPVPPKPNPAEPVNYIEWINKNLGGDVTNSAHKDYSAAAELIKRFEGDWPVEVQSGPWTGNARVVDWLAANSGGLQKFRLAAMRPACFFPMRIPRPASDVRAGGSMLRADATFLDSHCTAARALVCEGWQAWQKGDRSLLPRNVVLVLRAGHHLDSQPTVIGHFAGTACAELAYNALRNALRLSNKPDELAADVVRDLDLVDPPWPPLADFIRYERLMAWDCCQRIFIPGDKPGDWKLHDPCFAPLKRMGVGDPSPNDKAAIAQIGFDATLLEFDAYYDAVEAWLRKPHTPAARGAPDLAGMVERSKNPLFKMLAPNLTRLKPVETRLTVQRRGMHLVVHLLARHGRDGKLPEKLDQLEIPDLAELRIDPFSGKDFIYKRNRDGFQLYSVSDNAKDDSGKYSDKWEEGDYVIWPPPAQR